MKKFLIPLFLFLGMVVFLAVGLQRDPREIPSPLIDKPAPAFSLPTLDPAAGPFSPADMKGRVWLLNVWATWCVACRQEHPRLVDFAQRHQVTIVGMSYKEIQPQDVQAQNMDAPAKLQLARERGQVWLSRYGNPYELSVLDIDGRVGILYGVYGVPETYVIDKQGIIRYKAVGEVTPDILASKILPLVQKLNAS
jgi:cytochrome c biogenesis protein CcmG, thiol:disulfide interchange protein DsbE